MLTAANNRMLVQPPPLPPPPSIDPIEGLLDTPAGTLVEGHSGDLTSVLGILGAATLMINHRRPGIELLGERVVLGSMAAGGVDTAIQARNVMADGGEGAQERGNPRSGIGSIAYAATGLVPAASFTAISGMSRTPGTRRMPGPRAYATLGLLALNSGVLGYELITRGPKIVRGEENASGYGSLLAAFGGFVVANHLMRR